MKLKPGGFWHFTFLVSGTIIGAIVWSIVWLLIGELVEVYVGRAMESYGVLFFLPYFGSMLVFTGVGIWLGNRVTLIGKRSPATIGSSGQLLVGTSWAETVGIMLFASLFVICPLLVLLIGKADVVVQAVICVVSPLIGGFVFYVLSPHKLFSPKPQIIIDEQGIVNSRWNRTSLSWEEVTTVQLVPRWRGGPIITIYLKDPEKYRDYLPSFRRGGYFYENGLPLNLTGLDRSTGEVWAFLTQLTSVRTADELGLFRRGKM